MRRTGLPGALGLAVALATAACGGSGDGAATTTGAPPTSEAGPAGPPGSFLSGGRSGPNPPTISGYQVPASVPCTPGGSVDVPVSYQTTGAMTVTFTVGVTQIEGYPPLSGTFGVPVPCDGNAHSIVLFAVATDTSTSTESKAVVAGG